MAVTDLVRVDPQHPVMSEVKKSASKGLTGSVTAVEGGISVTTFLEDGNVVAVHCDAYARPEVEVVRTRTGQEPPPGARSLQWAFTTLGEDGSPLLSESELDDITTDWAYGLLASVCTWRSPRVTFTKKVTTEIDRIAPQPITRLMATLSRRVADLAQSWSIVSERLNAYSETFTARAAGKACGRMAIAVPGSQVFTDPTICVDELAHARGVTRTQILRDLSRELSALPDLGGLVVNIVAPSGLVAVLVPEALENEEFGWASEALVAQHLAATVRAEVTVPAPREDAGPMVGSASALIGAYIPEIDDVPAPAPAPASVVEVDPSVFDAMFPVLAPAPEILAAQEAEARADRERAEAERLEAERAEAAEVAAIEEVSTTFMARAPRPTYLDDQVEELTSALEQVELDPIVGVGGVGAQASDVLAGLAEVVEPEAYAPVSIDESPAPQVADEPAASPASQTAHLEAWVAEAGPAERESRERGVDRMADQAVADASDLLDTLEAAVGSLVEARAQRAEAETVLTQAASGVDRATQELEGARLAREEVLARTAGLGQARDIAVQCAEASKRHLEDVREQIAALQVAATAAEIAAADDKTSAEAAVAEYDEHAARAVEAADAAVTQVEQEMFGPACAALEAARAAEEQATGELSAARESLDVAGRVASTAVKEAGSLADWRGRPDGEVRERFAGLRVAAREADQRA